MYLFDSSINGFLFDDIMNFKQKREYKEESFLCDSCQTKIDENTHVLHCRAYKDLRE